jgi:hypothetical protein
MQRYVAKGLELPDQVDEDNPRVDLIFYDVDHSGDSYEARIFIDNPTATLDTPREAASGYAGSFTIFGHGGCYGDVGHCDVPTGPRDPFDLRPPHPLTPFTKIVTVTEAVHGLTGAAIDVTIVAVRAGEASHELSDALRFSRIRLAAYVD